MGRILGGLALRVVKVRGHGDHCPVEIVIEGVLGPLAQRGQDFGADLDGRFDPMCGVQGQHPFTMLDETVRQFVSPGHIGQAATHEPFDRCNGVLGIRNARRQGLPANLATSPCEIPNHRRQDHLPLAVGQAFDHPMTNGGDKRMRGAEVNANSHPSLVGIGRLPGFGNLEKRHAC